MSDVELAEAVSRWRQHQARVDEAHSPYYAGTFDEMDHALILLGNDMRLLSDAYVASSTAATPPPAPPLPGDELWLEFLHRPTNLCGLCGNTGTVRTKAVSPAGVKCGVERPCICPNGRKIKEMAEEFMRLGYSTSQVKPTFIPPTAADIEKVKQWAESEEGRAVLVDAKLLGDADIAKHTPSLESVVESLVTRLAERDAEIARLNKESSDKSRLFNQVCDGVMRDCLVAISGAVCTPEKGYKEDGGFNLMLADIKQLRKQHDGLLECHNQRNRHEREPNLPDCECPVCNVHRRLTTANTTIARLEREVEEAREALNRIQRTAADNDRREAKELLEKSDYLLACADLYEREIAARDTPPEPEASGK